MNASLLAPADHARPPPSSQALAVAPLACAGANALSASGTKNSASRDRASSEQRKGTEVRGWSDLVKTTRQCSVGSCSNVVPPEWPWKRCRSCRAAPNAGQKMVTVCCASCRSSVPVRATVAKSGQPILCMACHTQGPSGMHRSEPKERPPLSTMGPPPPKQFNQSKRKALAPGPQMQHQPQNVLEAAAAFVHPDHLHVLQLPEATYRSLRSTSHHNLALLYSDPPVPTLGSAHYGPRGEILVVMPGGARVLFNDHSRVESHHHPGALVTTEPSLHPQTGRTPTESIVVSEATSVHEKMAVEGPREGTTTPPKNDAPKRRVILKLPSGPSELIGSHSKAADDITVPPLKRKRPSPALTPFPIEGRLCISSGCGRPIPPNAKGEFCADCGFILWRKQFRARVVGLSASISGDGEPARSEPTSAAPADGGFRRPRGRASVRDLPDEVVDADEEDVPLAVALARKQASVTPFKAPSPASVAPRPSPTHADPRIQHVTPTPEPARRRPTPPSTKLAPSPPSNGKTDNEAAVLQHAPSEPRSSCASEASRQVSELKEVRPSEILPPTSTLPPKSPVPSANPLPSHVNRPRSPPLSLSPPPVDRPVLKIRIKVPKHLRRKRKSSLERQLGWDSDLSDLTPLEESTDEGESEVDPADSESESESESDDEPLANRIKTLPDAQTEPEGRERSASLPAPLKHRSVCTGVGCANLVPEEFRRRECNVCHGRKRSAKRRLHLQRLMATDTIEEIKVRILFYVVLPQSSPEPHALQMPVDGDLTGYRRCTRGSCKRMIPPEAEYRYKRCPQCRLANRNHVRARRAMLSGLSEDEQGDDALLIEPPCARAQVNSRKKAEVDNRPSPSPQDDRRLPDVPAYQHFPALLAALHDRFREFKCAQRRYLQFKVQQEARSPEESKPPRRAIIFRFDGEYSVVADPSGGVVDATVQDVWKNVQAALDLPFTAVGVNAGPESSVIAILRCVYAAQVPLLTASTEVPSPAPPSDADPRQSAEQAALVKMMGELQICVAWDRRHKYFPGQRILVRFRLVG
ncbi:hypothetical protein FKP32DRAFT_1683307 [Trametes sanguinea]|nr:hypothetical protein FKP32DRAFT_1683307 [Trametes sanguinea]